MRIEMKRWAGLGLAGALAGAGLAGCAEEAPEDPAAESAGADGAMPGEAGEGEGGEGGEGEGGEGEGGEGGEGGVDFTAAASDPVVYLTALAVAEAHALAAYDAFRAGKTDPAAEMYGHPVSEVLADMDPVFAELGVDDFKPRFNEASQTVLDGGDETEVRERHDAVLAAIEQAAGKAPDSQASGADVAARVTADMIDRATAMYGEAQGSDRYEPYLDGYGFTRAAARTFEDAQSAISAESPDLAARIREALDLLQEAYPAAERPATLDVERGKLLGAASRVTLAL
ncbi:MAG: hypothetical protein ACOCYR_02855 [Erythrobacter sp.]